VTFTIRWHRVSLRSSKADSQRALYAYLHPETDRILYIGKADRHSVRQRLSGKDKDGLWDFFAKEGIDRYGLLVGRVQPNIDIRRFTGQMLSDIESLLIHRIKPPGNIQCLRGRTRRPGMTVQCEGDWPRNKSVFRDV